MLEADSFSTSKIWTKVVNILPPKCPQSDNKGAVKTQQLSSQGDTIWVSNIHPKDFPLSKEQGHRSEKSQHLDMFAKYKIFLFLEKVGQGTWVFKKIAKKTSSKMR